MKKPVFFVQNNYVERLTIPVAKFVREQGYVLEDRSATPEFDPEDCGIDWSQYHPVLAYGSVQMMRKLKQSPSVSRYILHSEEAFSTARWTGIFGSKAVNHRGRLVLAKDVPALLADGLWLHVRPDSRDKAFIATVFDAESWETMRSHRVFEDELECWASPFVELKGEWRCWVIGGKVVEISQYRKDGLPHRVLEDNPAVWDAALALSKVYMPAPAAVLDIALTEEGYQVLEFNPIHGSGWYAARVGKVLQAWLDWSTEYFAESVEA